MIKYRWKLIQYVWNFTGYIVRFRNIFRRFSKSNAMHVDIQIWSYICCELIAPPKAYDKLNKIHVCFWSTWREKVYFKLRFTSFSVYRFGARNVLRPFKVLAIQINLWQTQNMIEWNGYRQFITITIKSNTFGLFSGICFPLSDSYFCVCSTHLWWLSIKRDKFFVGTIYSIRLAWFRPNSFWPPYAVHAVPKLNEKSKTFQT